MAEIRSFEDLDAWKLGFELTIKVYKASEKFPNEERFALTNQLRRAANSIPANIAEGFGRYTLKEYLRFLFYARGSVAETQSHLQVATTLGYLSKSDFDDLLKLCERTRQTVQGLIRHIRLKLKDPGFETSLDYLRETEADYPVEEPEI